MVVREGSQTVTGPQFELEFEDQFTDNELDTTRWIPYSLPHWSSWERSAARYAIDDGYLRLLIERDQEPWCPELDGPIRVSLLQTSLFAGPVGSPYGTLRFNPAAIVRSGPYDIRLYTPRYGRFEVRARAVADPEIMVALWMAGFEDTPEHSGEILVCEIFGHSVTRDSAAVGVGIRPFADPDLVDEFATVTVPIDATEFHTYSVDWVPEQVRFFIDGEQVKHSAQSPAYPMQLMLGIYEFNRPADREPDEGDYPKTFTVDYVRGYRLVR
jgi:hypothetical protein